MDWLKSRELQSHAARCRDDDRFAGGIPFRSTNRMGRMTDKPQTTQNLIEHRFKLIALQASLSAQGCAGTAANMNKDIDECNRLLEIAIKNEDYLARHPV